MAETPEPTGQVKIRRVFYIPGYDPFPPQRYRKLYEMEGPKQAAISNYRLTVRPERERGHAWEAEAEIDRVQSRAAFEVLEWSDIVRETMQASLVASYLQLLHVAWTYLSHGTLLRLAWLRKGPIIAGFYPVLMLLAQLGAAMVLGKIAAVAATGALAFALDWVFGLWEARATGSRLWAIADGVLGWVIFAVVTVGCLIWAKARDGKLCAYYLMHDLAFSVSRNGAYPQVLEDRMDAFRRRIASALAGPADEVLVIGHSSGAQLAVSVVAGLLREGMMPANGPTLSLLTLGQAIPMVSFLPEADGLRRDLHDLAGDDRITWVDISAPGDGCTFALCDPVAVTGVAPEPQRWPLILSAAYTNTLSDETRRALKWRFFRLHIQYLCAFDRPGTYDYFKITAGSLTLGQRFADRKPSVSRIDVPVSRFRSMAA